MNYPFSRPAFDLRAWSDVNRALEEFRSQLLYGSLSASDLSDFCRRAVADALPLPENPSLVFWGYDAPDTMPGDARCDFFYHPTYLMAQCLMASILRDPDLLMIPGVRDVLDRGLAGCAARNLSGYGYDAESGRLRNLASFLEAGFCRFAIIYPEIAPDFRRMVLSQLSQVQKDYSAGNHVFGMGDNLKSEQEKLLSLLPDRLPGDLTCRPGESLYIAYGSNMDEDQMSLRCPDAILVATGYLQGYRLEFFRHATVTRTGNPSDKVPAALWRISAADEAALDRYEGVPAYYSRHYVIVYLKSGEEAQGLIYLMNTRHPAPPEPTYLESILQSYKRLGFAVDRGTVLLSGQGDTPSTRGTVLLSGQGDTPSAIEQNVLCDLLPDVPEDAPAASDLNGKNSITSIGKREKALSAPAHRKNGHPLSAGNVTHKKLYAFSMNGEVIEADGWKSFLTKLATILYEKDPSVLESLALSAPVPGERNLKLSLYREELRYPAEISHSGIFIETNKSAETIRQWAILLLQAHRVPRASVRLFY